MGVWITTGQVGGEGQWSDVSNIDIDIGVETVDSFAASECKAAFWNYVVSKGANLRAGRIYACWDNVADSIPAFAHTSTSDIGDTSGVSFDVDKLGNTVRLRCTVTSNDWAVHASRVQIGG